MAAAAGGAAAGGEADGEARKDKKHKKHRKHDEEGGEGDGEKKAREARSSGRARSPSLTRPACPQHKKKKDKHRDEEAS